MITKQMFIDALSDLLDAIDRAPDPVNRLQREPGPVSLADFGTNYALINSPISEALRLGVTELGKTMGQHLTIEEMRDVAESASKQTGSKIGVDVCDKRWNGIEDKNGSAWWS